MGKFSRQHESLIASFRGLPEESLPLRDAGAKTLGSLLEICIEKFHIGRNTPEETIQENWARIVGAPFASRCRPERIDRSGALIVQVGNPTLRRELIFHEDRIMTVLHSLPDCHHIKRIVLKSG
jgi:hypothetical protein